MPTNEELYEFAQRYIPGGVSASARANAALGRPFYISRGDGAYVYDLAGQPYVDLCISHGASLLGHNHPSIRAAVAQALELGVICAYETEHQSALAEKICAMTPCAEMVRFAGSGTETLMYAVRLARSHTGRSKIIKFEGHFHGYSDHVFYSSAPPLAEAGPAGTPAAYRQSSGMPAELDHRRALQRSPGARGRIRAPRRGSRHPGARTSELRLRLHPAGTGLSGVVPQPL
jgi:glutamate-1-semialdehyde 2,1-aminomutase